MKKLWEKLDKFDIVAQTADSSFQFPRGGDKFLMLVFIDRGHSRGALIWLNRVRLHLQIIFLSNILSALGLRIDPTVLWHWDPSICIPARNGPKRSQQSSTLSFGERPWKTFAPASLESTVL
jgi:hypothetical protein